GEALDAPGQLVMDVGGGDHRLLAFRPGLIEDSLAEPAPAFAEDPALAFARLAVVFSGHLGESSSHSKVSEIWKSEDVFHPQLFQIFRGFSSFSRDFDAKLYISLPFRELVLRGFRDNRLGFFN